MKKITLSLILLAFTAGPLFAQPGERPHRLMRDQIEKLNLTEQQQEALRAQRSATQKEMIDLRAEMKKLRLDLADMRRSENPDRTTFASLTRGLADLRVRQAMLRFDAHEKMLAELTAEQKEMFRDMQKDMKRNFRDGRGSRPRGARHECGRCDGGGRGIGGGRGDGGVRGDGGGRGPRD